MIRDQLFRHNSTHCQDIVIKIKAAFKILSQSFGLLRIDPYT